MAGLLNAKHQRGEPVRIIQRFKAGKQRKQMIEFRFITYSQVFHLDQQSGILHRPADYLVGDIQHLLGGRVVSDKPIEQRLPNTLAPGKQLIFPARCLF